jgi:hypothetical protein
LIKVCPGLDGRYHSKVKPNKKEKDREIIQAFATDQKEDGETNGQSRYDHFGCDIQNINVFHIIENGKAKKEDDEKNNLAR